MPSLRQCRPDSDTYIFSSIKPSFSLLTQPKSQPLHKTVTASNMSSSTPSSPAGKATGNGKSHLPLCAFNNRSLIPHRSASPSLGWWLHPRVRLLQRGVQQGPLSAFLHRLPHARHSSLHSLHSRGGHEVAGQGLRGRQRGHRSQAPSCQRGAHWSS